MKKWLFKPNGTVFPVPSPSQKPELDQGLTIIQKLKNQYNYG